MLFKKVMTPNTTKAHQVTLHSSWGSIPGVVSHLFLSWFLTDLNRFFWLGLF